MEPGAERAEGSDGFASIRINGMAPGCRAQRLKRFVDRCSAFERELAPGRMTKVQGQEEPRGQENARAECQW